MKATIYYRNGSTHTIGNVTNYDLNGHGKITFYTSKYIQPTGVIIDSNIIIRLDSDILYIVVKDFGTLVEVIPSAITKFDIFPNATQLKELEAQDAELKRIKESRARRSVKNATRLRAHIKEKELARKNNL